jgi:MFS transporter, DHA1 family, inner membrane transport protein
MDVARDSQSIAAALNHSALNVANSLGAYLGSVAIAAGLGYISPVWIGIVLSMLGGSIAAFAFGLDRMGARSTSRLRAAESILIDNRRASHSPSLCR